MFSSVACSARPDPNPLTPGRPVGGLPCLEDTVKEIVTDLCDRLHLLRLRYDVVFCEPTHDNPPYVPMAEALVRGLREGRKTAVVLVRSLIDPADMEKAEFWGTPLGRRLFLAGGHPDVGISQATAAALMGCSRQWISMMIKEGKLSSGVVGGVYAEEVREVLKARIDRLVK